MGKVISWEDVNGKEQRSEKHEGRLKTALHYLQTQKDKQLKVKEHKEARQKEKNLLSIEDKPFTSTHEDIDIKTSPLSPNSQKRQLESHFSFIHGINLHSSKNLLNVQNYRLSRAKAQEKEKGTLDLNSLVRLKEFDIHTDGEDRNKNVNGEDVSYSDGVKPQQNRIQKKTFYGKRSVTYHPGRKEYLWDTSFCSFKDIQAKEIEGKSSLNRKMYKLSQILQQKVKVV